MKRSFRLLVLLIFMAVLSGCMSFNRNTLPVVDDVKAPKDKAVVIANVGSFLKLTNGMYGNQAPKLGNALLKDVVNRWKQKDLISYGGSNDDGKPAGLEAGYTLSLSGSSDEQYSPFAAKLTGATLGLIPSWSTVEQTVKAELVNRKTSITYTVEAKSSSTVAVHLLFLPFFLAQGVGIANMHEDMADYIYSEMYKQGAFN